MFLGIKIFTEVSIFEEQILKNVNSVENVLKLGLAQIYVDAVNELLTNYFNLLI